MVLKVIFPLAWLKVFFFSSLFDPSVFPLQRISCDLSTYRNAFHQLGAALRAQIKSGQIAFAVKMDPS